MKTPITVFSNQPFNKENENVGYDLASTENVIVPGRGTAIISTGVQLAIPEDLYGMVCGRSGLAFKHNLFSFNGSLDPGFRGEIKVKLFNFSADSYEIMEGDRVAQLVFLKYVSPSFVTVTPELFPESVRGLNGFGSTGK